MGRLRAHARGIQRCHHRVDSVHPFDGRSPLFHLFDAMGVNDAKGKLSSGHQLGDQRVPLAPLYLLHSPELSYIFVFSLCPRPSSARSTSCTPPPRWKSCLSISRPEDPPTASAHPSR